MGFENFDPNTFEEQNEGEHGEATGKETDTPESLEETPIETRGDAPEPEEKTEEELLEEYWPSPETPKEEETSPSWGKAAIAAAALAGTLAAGTEAYAGGKDMFDSLETEEKRIQEPAERKTISPTHKKETGENRIQEKAREGFEDVEIGEQMAQQAIDHIRNDILPNETNPSERAKLQTIIEMPANKVWSKTFIDKGIIQFGGLYTDPVSGTEKPFIFQYKVPGH